MFCPRFPLLLVSPHIYYARIVDGDVVVIVAVVVVLVVLVVLWFVTNCLFRYLVFHYQFFHSLGGVFLALAEEKQEAYTGGSRPIQTR